MFQNPALTDSSWLDRIFRDAAYMVGVKALPMGSMRASESELDCIMCSKFARQRFVRPEASRTSPPRDDVGATALAPLLREAAYMVGVKALPMGSMSDSAMSTAFSDAPRSSWSPHTKNLGYM